MSAARRATGGQIPMGPSSSPRRANPETWERGVFTACYCSPRSFLVLPVLWLVQRIRTVRRLLTTPRTAHQVALLTTKLYREGIIRGSWLVTPDDATHFQRWRS